MCLLFIFLHNSVLEVPCLIKTRDTHVEQDRLTIVQDKSLVFYVVVCIIVLQFVFISMLDMALSFFFFSINECEFPSGIFHLSFDGRNLLWCGIQNLLINYVSTNKDGMFYFCVLTLWPNFSVATSQTKPIFCRQEHT